MALKIKYDVRHVPDSGGGVVIDPGLYQAEVTKIEDKKAQSGNGMFEVTLKITTKGDFKGNTIRTWIVHSDEDGNAHEASEFKLKELVRALGLKEKGTITDRTISDAIGTEIQIKVDADTYNGKPSAKVGTLMPLADEEDEDDDEEDEDDDEDDGDDDEDKQDPVHDDDDDDKDDDDEDEDDEDEEEEDEEDEEVDLKSLSLDDIKTRCKELGLKTVAKKNGDPVKGLALKKVLIGRIEKATEDDDDDDPFA